MLTFNLKKEWFEKIKSGEKTHEYREVKPYWTKRLNPTIDGEIATPTFCQFACGYPSKKDYSKWLLAYFIRYRIVNGKTTDLKIDKPVYDIEFEVIK